MQAVITRGALLALAIAAGCSDSPARVTLVPVTPFVDGTCGKPEGATELRVIGYAASGEIVRAVPLDGAIDIADFPADTEQLGVEVRIGGGAVGAAGKTAPLVFTDLEDGVTIPVFMAPPDGFCPTGNMVTARFAPLVARAGDGILIVGGVDAGGLPLATAERYDPATGTFTEVAVPSVLGENGFAGAAITPLPDGRVVISGGPQPVATIYDPVSHAFAPSVLIEGRALHGAIAIAPTEVLLAGGCSSITAAGECSGIARLSSKIYTVTDENTVVEKDPGVNLRAGRIGATIFEVGVQADGERAYVMAGGLPPQTGMPSPDAADRFSLAETDATALAGSRSQAVALDGGGVLTAFDPDLDPADGSATVFAATSITARVTARAPDLRGVRLVAQEDGRVLGLGGDPSTDVLRYDPMIDEWQRFAPPVQPPPIDNTYNPPALSAPRLHRLDDGSVLVLGGTVNGVVSNKAWIFRPSLIGPASGSVTVVPIGVARANVLTPSDPATVTRGTDWVIASGSEDLARALVGGPRMAAGSIRAVVRVRAGGVALIAQQVGPGQAIVAELAPGSPARLVELEGGTRRELCTGQTVAAFDPATSVILDLAIEGGRATLDRDDASLIACELGTSERGAWGLGALGAGAEVAVATVTVAR